MSEVEMADILQETKSTHSSEYSSGSPDEPGIERKLFYDANFASARASESAQLNSSYIVQYVYILSTVSCSVKCAMNLLLFPAAVIVFQ